MHLKLELIETPTFSILHIAHIHTILTAFELPRSIIQGPFGPTQPISTIQGDELEVSKSQKIFWPVVGSN